MTPEKCGENQVSSEARNLRSFWLWPVQVPTIPFPGAVMLMMGLPGEKAETVCTKAAEIFISLLHEIQAHAASDAPINNTS